MSPELVLSQLTSSAIVVYLLQWLKKASWFPWLTSESGTLNRIMSAILAAGGAIGIHFAYDSQQGSLLITGLTLVGVAHGVWHWLNQFALQQVMYDTVGRSGQPGPSSGKAIDPGSVSASKVASLRGGVGGAAMMLLAVGLAIGVAGCANKQLPLQIAQGSHDTLAIAQDLEAQLCFGVADAQHITGDKTHCTTQTATVIGLTDARHKAIAAKLKQAFDLHRTATALAQSGTTADTSTLNGIITEIVALLGQLQQTADVVTLTNNVRAAGGQQ